jgi:hypothetical protein
MTRKVRMQRHDQNEQHHDLTSKRLEVAEPQNLRDEPIVREALVRRNAPLEDACSPRVEAVRYPRTEEPDSEALSSSSLELDRVFVRSPGLGLELRELLVEDERCAHNCSKTIRRSFANVVVTCII